MNEDAMLDYYYETKDYGPVENDNRPWNELPTLDDWLGE